MATLNTGGLPTLLDLAKKMLPDGSPETDIVEMLMQQNPLIEDMVWREGNLQTGHLVTTRTGLPSPSWRRLNRGVGISKSSTSQFTETCGLLEGYSKVDEEVAELNGGMEYRADEDDSWVEGMGNSLEAAFFYESTIANPERIEGLTPRLDATSGNNAANQIIKHTGAASGNDQTSIWLVGHGPKTVFGIVPKGSKIGLTAKDMGLQLTKDEDGLEFNAWVTHHKWKAGLCVRDWRAIVRICNIDTSALDSTAFDLVTAMIKAYHRIPRVIRRTTRMVFYANRTISEALHLQAVNNTKQSTLRVQEIAGEEVTTILGVPIHEADALLNTEAPVT